MNTQTSPGPATAATGDRGGGGVQALLGVLKAFGGIVAIGTLFMWLTGQTYSDDILHRFGIASVFVDRPMQMEALLGVQVLMQWISDQAAAAGAIFSVAVLLGVVLILGVLIAKLPTFLAGIFVIVAGAGAFWMAPLIGHAEGAGYLADLQPLLDACRNDANACTTYQTAQGRGFKGVLITADSTKLFLATLTGVTQIPLASLTSVILPQSLGPQAPVQVATASTIAAAPPSTDTPSDGSANIANSAMGAGTGGQAAATPGQVMPMPVSPMPSLPMPEVLFPKKIPNLPMTHEPMPGRLVANKLPRPAPDFMPKGALVRHF